MIWPSPSRAARPPTRCWKWPSMKTRGVRTRRAWSGGHAGGRRGAGGAEVSQSGHLDLRFSRLLWPSALVREGAACEVARLLLDAALVGVVSARFLQWLASLRHESACGVALLPLLRAKLDSGG